MSPPALAFFDDDGAEVQLDDDEAAELLGATNGLDATTVSACPACRSRIVAAVALADALADMPAFARRAALAELAEDAPTLHLYVRDLTGDCRHRTWLDPGYEEWSDAMEDLADPKPRY